jgi:hypothetical protein
VVAVCLVVLMTRIELEQVSAGRVGGHVTGVSWQDQQVHKLPVPATAAKKGRQQS